MIKAQEISENKLSKKIGTTQEVIVDELDEEGAICRTRGDAPQIDGNLFIDTDFENLTQGQNCAKIFNGKRKRQECSE